MVKEWSFPDVSFDRVQRRAYLDGAHSFVGVADFVAFIDIDEFLFAERDRGLPSALNIYSADVGAVAINQRIFGSSGLLKYRNELVTTRFVSCSEPTHPESRWFKTVARPECVESFSSVHSVTLKTGRYILRDGTAFEPEGAHPGCAASIAPAENIGLYHYITKSKEEYETKKRKWSDTKVAARYDDAYFTYRDTNTMTVDNLVGHREDIIKQIGRMWPRADFAWNPCDVST